MDWTSQTIRARLIAARFLSASTDSPEVEDVAQEALTRAWENRERLRDPAAFRTWIRSIVLNTARLHLGRKSKLREDCIPEPSLIAAPMDHEPGELEDRARQALDGLPEKKRTLLKDRLIDGTDYQELAARYGMTPGSLRVAVSRNLAELREALTFVCPDSKAT